MLYYGFPVYDEDLAETLKYGSAIRIMGVDKNPREDAILGDLIIKISAARNIRHNEHIRRIYCWFWKTERPFGHKTTGYTARRHIIKGLQKCLSPEKTSMTGCWLAIHPTCPTKWRKISEGEGLSYVRQYREPILPFCCFHCYGFQLLGLSQNRICHLFRFVTLCLCCRYGSIGGESCHNGQGLMLAGNIFWRKMISTVPYDCRQ